MKAKRLTGILRRGLRIILLSLLLIIVSVITAVYVPGVLNFAARRILPSVEQSSGLKIDVDDIRLRFPLRLRLTGVKVIEPADTMVTASSLEADIRLMPLLHGNVAASVITAGNASYRMGNTDSMLMVRAYVDTIAIADAVLGLNGNTVDVNRALIAGGKIAVNLKNKADSPADSTATEPWSVRVGSIALRDIAVDYSMPPSVDSLHVDLGNALLTEADIFTGTPAEITARSIAISMPSATIARFGAEPQPGLDMNWLQVRNASIEVDSLRSAGTDLRLRLQRLAATERCGIAIDMNALVAMDSTAIQIENLSFHTLHSSLTGSILMGLDSIDAPLRADIQASLATPDAIAAYPMLAPLLKAAPQQTPLTVGISASGSMSDLQIDRISAEMQRVFSLSASGTIYNIDAPEHLGGKIDMKGNVASSPFVRQAVANAKLGMKVNVPPMAMRGNLAITDGLAKGDIRIKADNGAVALSGSLNASRQRFMGQLELSEFPIDVFLPDLEIGRVSASLEARGQGFDPTDSASVMKADIRLHHAEYRHAILHNIDFSGSVEHQRLNACLHADMPYAKMHTDINGFLRPRSYSWVIHADINHLDLQRLALADSVMNGSFSLKSDGRTAADLSSLEASFEIGDLNWKAGTLSLRTPLITASVEASDSTIDLMADNVGLSLNASAECGIDSLMRRTTELSDAISGMIAQRRMSVDSLNRSLPPVSMIVKAHGSNLLSSVLAQSSITAKDIDLKAFADSTLRMRARAVGIRSGVSTRVDTLGVDLCTTDTALHLTGFISNRKGTMDEFTHVDARLNASGRNAALIVEQKNIDLKTGYRIGMDMEIEDSAFTMHFKPYDPIIAYKPWHVNADNFIAYDETTRRLSADIDLTGDRSRLLLYTDEPDTTGGSDIILQVSDVHLADWLAMSPFAPEVNGILQADITVKWNPSLNTINGHGTAGLNDFTYGRQHVGSFGLDFGLSTNATGRIRAITALSVDSARVLTASGVLNDSTTADPLRLDLRMTRFPLQVANPFLPEDMASLTGWLNGHIDVGGSLKTPVFNGEIDFDSAQVTVPMIGSSFKFDDNPISVLDGVVTFKNYTIAGMNKNPLTINGRIDMRDISLPHIDLSMQADNMQLVDSKKRRKVQVYGKAFANLRATAKGTLDFLRVNAALDLLRTTNVTYIMAGASSSQLGLQKTTDMVQFVNFADSEAVAAVDSLKTRTTSTIMLNASLSVQDGATINVDLSSDGGNKVQILPSGKIDYTLSPLGDERVTGRININSGFVRYTPPLISEKLFNFRNGSYVVFNGDMLNPTLHILADDDMRVNVTTDGGSSRMVNFDVSLTATGSLDDMNVKFDLSTTDDITVQNELQSMSAEQRASQAMNMLLYGVYTGPSSKSTSGDIAGNALYSFLEGQINSWAANNIKGVDLSFGMDQNNTGYNNGTFSGMNYSYKVSKSLFNDRFKIVVGGNYSTDADADENFSQNLISDISFEYLVNNAGTMVIKIFRHTGYESILEGEITQTGVGFAYRRKLQRLSELFTRPLRTIQSALPFVDDNKSEKEPDK